VCVCVCGEREEVDGCLGATDPNTFCNSHILQKEKILK
jgi:hypothetical protein